MPAKSKAQFRLLQAIKSGSAKVKGFSKKEAEDYLNESDYKKLPEKKKKPYSYGKLKK